ncbi:MAG: glycerate kinase [Acidobacteriota bacterium]
MTILLAPDKFRGTFTARQVCANIARGLGQVSPGVAVVSLPLADGGEGTLDTLGRVMGTREVSIQARGPLGDPIEGAVYGMTPDGRTAIIESARFCGLSLVAAHRRDPWRASSGGLGTAIEDALDAGARHVLIGLGGTATIDGGVGMAEALGYRFLRAGSPPSVVGIDSTGVHPAIGCSRFTCLCDVDNPLLGPDGAAAIFGPQKGASPGQVVLLERRLASLAAAIRRWKGEESSGLVGTGAGGGLGAGAAAFLGAVLRPGTRVVMDLTGFPEALARCDLVVTGEGSFDAQSCKGKVTGAVLEAAA